MTEETLVCGPNDDGRRVDRILRVRFPGAGLSRIFALIGRGRTG
jgi:hypothetical protein